MNHIDLIILAIIGFSVIIGVVRGFTRELLSLLSWGSAGFLTFLTYPVVQLWLQKKISNPMLADVASGVITFTCFLLIFGLLSHLLANWIQNSVLSGLDRSLGLLFGALRGFLLLCIGEFALSCFVPKANYPESFFLHYVEGGSEKLLTLLPPTIKEFFVHSRKTSGAQTLFTDTQKTIEKLSTLQPKQEKQNTHVFKAQEDKMNRLDSLVNKKAPPKEPDEALEALLD